MDGNDDVQQPATVVSTSSCDNTDHKGVVPPNIRLTILEKSYFNKIIWSLRQ